MEQNRKPQNFIYIYIYIYTHIQRERESQLIYSEWGKDMRNVSSIKGFGKTGQPHTGEWN